MSPAFSRVWPVLFLLAVLTGSVLPVAAAPSQPVASTEPQLAQANDMLGPERAQVALESPPIAPPSVLPQSTVADAHIESPAVMGQQLAPAFEENRGQVDPAVRYMSRTTGGSVFFTADEVVLTLPMPSLSVPKVTTGVSNSVLTSPNTIAASSTVTATGVAAIASADLHVVQPVTTTLAVTRVRLDGANLSPNITAVTRVPGDANYFHGSQSTWITDVARYAGVRYADIYPGIDVQYDASRQGYKSTFFVAPGADASRIRWRYSLGQPSVDSQGSLVLAIPAAPTSAVPLGTDAHAAAATPIAPTAPLTVTEQALVAYQDRNGQRQPVDARFVVAADGAVSFALGAYV